VRQPHRTTAANDLANKHHSAQYPSLTDDNLLGTVQRRWSVTGEARVLRVAAFVRILGGVDPERLTGVRRVVGDRVSCDQ
jgi:hypothetical protein